MRGERANSRQLASQDTARAAIGHPCGYEVQFAGLISVALGGEKGLKTAFMRLPAC